MAPKSDNVPTPNPRWYVPTPAKFLFAVLVMQGVLFLSAHYRWFWFNERKGLTVLITVAATVSSLLLLVAADLLVRVFRIKLQFSLATLLTVFPVMAIPCAWFAQEMAVVRRQRQALNAWQTMSSETFFDDQVIDPSLPRSLDWLKRGLGRDFFADLVATHLFSATDADLESVELFEKLRTLSVADSNITDDGASRLAKLPSLRRIDFSYTKISDASLIHLGGCNQLEKLVLRKTQVTDAGTIHLARLNNLNWLDLSETTVSDAGIKRISKLEQLERLALNQTQITDAGLEYLKNLKHLKMLQIYETGVTDVGVKSFREALPNCDVTR